MSAHGPKPNTRHRIYERLIGRWSMVRDAVEGEYAVKAAGDAYLPKLTGASDAEYNAYKRRALFFEATRRTLSGLIGMVTRKEPQIEASESTKEGFLSRLTKDGQSLNALSQIVMRETLMLNKYGLLADLPKVITKKSEPWLVGYTAETMINWKYGVDESGRQMLVRMVLEEEYEQTDPTDRFKAVHNMQWRVLEVLLREVAEADNMPASENQVEQVLPIQPAGTNLIYRVQVWRKRKDSTDAAIAASSSDEEFIMHDEFFPAFQGKAMITIPFVVITAEDEDKEDQKPPLEGLASINMSHYRTSADLEHGRHFTALPTPYVIGLAEQQELTIGSSKAWMIAGVSAQEVKIGMLEFSGQGLEALENAMEEKQKQMVVLGARLLEETKKSVEAFETHQLRSAGEQSILASVTTGVSEGINEALDIIEGWDPSLGKITLQLNTDFIIIGMDPTMLTALIAAMQASRMSFKTFFFNMQQRGMYPDTYSEEDELKQIELEAPAMEADDLDEGNDEEDDEEDDEGDDEE